MFKEYELTGANGRRFRWRIVGGEAIAFFARIAWAAQLEETPCPPGETPDVEFAGLPAEEWGKLECRPVGNLQTVLKARQDDRWRTRCYWNTETELTGLNLLQMRRTLFFLAFFPGVMAGELAVMHGALFENAAGHGMLLSGPSGIGKSTCAAKVRSPWRVWCDDSVLVSRTAAGFQAQPLPTWSIWLRDESARNRFDTASVLPLKILAFLERQPEDAVTELSVHEARIGLGEASSLILREASYAVPRAIQPRLFIASFDFALDLAARIRAYRLAHTLPGRPWEQL